MEYFDGASLSKIDYKDLTGIYIYLFKTFIQYFYFLLKKNKE